MKHVETIALPHDLGEFTEIIDVRAPSEYEEDHLPGAINLPVLSDAQRIEVGTLHKHDPFSARRVGARYISSNIAEHLKGHLANKEKSYAPLIYCWRGGMRSNSLAHVLRSIGWRARVLDGGYKDFRKFVTEETQRIFQQKDLRLTVLAGQTGVAKTRLLHVLKNQGAQVLDLEGLANHRGSVLGLALNEKQPSQKQFETRLWHTMSCFDPALPIFTEAESNRIGALHCPASLWKKLGSADVVNIELPVEKRAAFLLDDYPHFTQNPDHLKGLLDRLVKLRGHEQVEIWYRQIDAGKWLEFVTSVLRDHYDLVYRRAGDEKSNYQEPCYTVRLAEFSEADLVAAAQELIHREGRS